jgi:choline kinase
MQALILAAGMGSRLGALTAEATKCMVRLHGRRLIERLFDGLAGLGLSRAVLVVGHGAAELRAALGHRFAGLPIVYVENPDYRGTNNIYSLSLAAEELCADDTLLIESDLVLDPAILRMCAHSDGPAAAAVASYQPWMDGTVTLLDAEGWVARFVPKQALDPARPAGYYKTVNIYRLGRRFCADLLVPELRAHMARVGAHVYYEEVLGRIVDEGRSRVRAVVVDGLPWYEIDTAEDLRAAEALFAPGPLS